MDPDRGESKSQIRWVFVYGTLMKGFANYDNYLKGHVSRIMKGETIGRLYHLPQGYPALVDGGGVIKGEVMELNAQDVLKKLDRMEGFEEGGTDNLYERETRTVALESGERVECWVYLFCDEAYAENNGIEIPGGDWRKFIQKEGALR